MFLLRSCGSLANYASVLFFIFTYNTTRRFDCLYSVEKELWLFLSATYDASSSPSFAKSASGFITQQKKRVQWVNTLHFIPHSKNWCSSFTIADRQICSSGGSRDNLPLSNVPGKAEKCSIKRRRNRRNYPKKLFVTYLNTFLGSVQQNELRLLNPISILGRNRNWIKQHFLPQCKLLFLFLHS